MSDDFGIMESESQGKPDDEVLFIGNVHDIPEDGSAVRLGYNAVVHCRQGRVELEVGGDHSKKVSARSGQVLLLPANKLLQPMMVSTDVKATVLLVSDKVLREVLGHHIDIWNRAMFLNETYVIDGGKWIIGAASYAETLLTGGGTNPPVRMRHEIVLSFLRTMFLMICETLSQQLRTTDETHDGDNPTLGERAVFDQFLSLLAKEPHKRQHVNYYASRLNISPKYLSTVCKHVSDKSPTRWIAESVMEDIYQQLRGTNLSVKEISNRMGFPNSSFFGQYFREKAGMTPLEYRNRIKDLL